MADLVNLRLARKAKRRADAEAIASRNRASFGRSASARAGDPAARERSERLLDGHSRATDPPHLDDEGGR